QVLAAIIRDLASAPEADRPYLRYYSLANLWNSVDVEESELELYRMALSKLVNHLSWEKEITQPRQLGFENTVLRIDLRNYRWTAETWREIIAPIGKVSTSPATIPGKTFSGIRWIFGRTAGKSFSICRMVSRRTSSRTGKGNELTPHP